MRIRVNKKQNQINSSIEIRMDFELDKETFKLVLQTLGEHHYLVLPYNFSGFDKIIIPATSIDSILVKESED